MVCEMTGIHLCVPLPRHDFRKDTLATRDGHGDIQNRLVVHEDQDARSARHPTRLRYVVAPDPSENHEQDPRQEPAAISRT